jgi:predicted AlkP superfamily pyrophosphatase or phosphodiesterase
MDETSFCHPSSQLDVAPTIARVLQIRLPNADGCIIDGIAEWGCRNVVLIIIDSLGYDLFLWLEPWLHNMSALVKHGQLHSARAVSNHTTPAIATILSGLLPEHHGIFNKAGAKETSILSLPEIASDSGFKAAVIMERNGAEVYQGLIEIIGGISDRIPPADFDREACRLTQQALAQSPRILVTYFIGIDKAVHNGGGPKEIREAALVIDQCLGKIIGAAKRDTLFVLCGDHPIHAGPLKRMKEPYNVALILAKAGAKVGENSSLR